MSPFERAFAAARAAKKTTFRFKGDSYTTKLEGEDEKGAPTVAARPTRGGAPKPPSKPAGPVVQTSISQPKAPVAAQEGSPRAPKSDSAPKKAKTPSKPPTSGPGKKLPESGPVPSVADKVRKIVYPGLRSAVQATSSAVRATSSAVDRAKTAASAALTRARTPVQGPPPPPKITQRAITTPLPRGGFTHRAINPKAKGAPASAKPPKANPRSSAKPTAGVPSTARATPKTKPTANAHAPNPRAANVSRRKKK